MPFFRDEESIDSLLGSEDAASRCCSFTAWDAAAPTGPFKWPLSNSDFGSSSPICPGSGHSSPPRERIHHRRIRHRDVETDGSPQIAAHQHRRLLIGRRGRTRDGGAAACLRAADSASSIASRPISRAILRKWLETYVIGHTGAAVGHAARGMLDGGPAVSRALAARHA